MNDRFKFRAWDGKRYMFPALWDNSMPTNWEKHYTLEQFTGLTDKNGVEIYEGDIVNIPKGYGGDRHYETCEAIIKYDAPEFYPHTLNDKHGVVWQDFEWKRLTVIGNIHENPDLLTPTTEEG